MFVFQYLEPCTTLHTPRYQRCLPQLKLNWELDQQKLIKSSPFHQSLSKNAYHVYPLSLVFYFFFNPWKNLQVQVKTLKKNHPAVVMVATFCFAYFMVYQFGCILVFLSGVIFPFLFMIVHASLRLRNAKNKVRTFFLCIFILILYGDNILGKCCQGSILEENWKRESG